MAKYAHVIVPVPLPAVFTYIVPDDMSEYIRPGMRVVVPFGGAHKFYTGIVTETVDKFEGNYDLRPIVWCPDIAPVLRRPQLKLWEWMADYYMSAIGDVMKAALPGGLKIESETLIECNDEVGAEASEQAALTTLSSKAVTVWEKIKELNRTGKVSVRDLERAGISSVMASVYELIGAGLVLIRENHAERFRAKKMDYYHILMERDDPDVLNNVFSRIRSPRHQKLLMLLLSLSDFTRKGAPLKEVSRDAVKDDESFDTAVLRSFVKKGIISIETREISRFKWNARPLQPLPSLSTAQRNALSAIHQNFTDHDVVLLHGVTSSGKTEIYKHLIDFTLRLNRSVLFLVPEIALTTQLTTRLQNTFGDKVVIYHSRFSDSERVEIWMRILHSAEPLVVIGARSAVFLPFHSLGLVIVDEEHEQSYKQFDPAPRYNARDTAIVLSRMHGAKTLLASATPSVETYYKAVNGRFGLVELTERFSGVNLPEIEIVDIGKERLKGTMGESLSQQALQEANRALAAKNQVILFHNRRGYSPIARCKACAYTPKCEDCAVSLSYHKNINRLVCHYCGREYPLPSLCPLCGQPTVEVVGFGTERIEDNVADVFPEYRVLRMDLDTTRNKEHYADIIEKFSEHHADILVGTQMVTKGLDFGDVSTVVVLNADMLFNYPDFRAAERAFNMLEQVSGRAGRRQETPGKVIIQTRRTDHPLLQYVLAHDYRQYYEYELEERRKYNYPPFTRLVYVVVRSKDAVKCRTASEILAAALRKSLGNRIYGPHEPAVNRIKTLYIRRIMVKIEPGVSIKQVKDILLKSASDVRSMNDFRSIDIYFDVDPS